MTRLPLSPPTTRQRGCPARAILLVPPVLPDFDVQLLAFCADGPGVESVNLVCPSTGDAFPMEPDEDRIYWRTRDGDTLLGPGDYVVCVRTSRGQTCYLPVSLGLERDWAVVDCDGADWTNDRPRPEGKHLIVRNARFNINTPRVRLWPTEWEGQATGMIQFDNCFTVGDDDRPQVDIVRATEWRAGVWLRDCSFEKVRMPTADVKGAIRVRCRKMREDFIRNWLASYDCMAIDVGDEAREESDHRDAVQCSFKTTPAVVAHHRLTALAVFGQGLFARCDAIGAGLFSRVLIDQRGIPLPDGLRGYWSQLRGVAWDDLVLNDVLIKDSTSGFKPRFTIRNDDADRMSSVRRFLMREVKADGGVTIDTDIVPASAWKVDDRGMASGAWIAP